MRVWLSVVVLIGLLILAALLTSRSPDERPVLAEGLRLALRFNDETIKSPTPIKPVITGSGRSVTS